MNATHPADDTLTLLLPSDLTVLDQVVEATQDYLAARLDDEDLAYRVLLLATEAVTNAIEHGNQLDASKQVRMSLRVLPGQVELSVEDEGGGFDPASVENPLRDENLLEDSGRGIFLIEQMADEVYYEHEGRRVRMFFNRSA